MPSSSPLSQHHQPSEPEINQALQQAQTEHLIDDSETATIINHNPNQIASQPDRPIHQTLKGTITALIFALIIIATIAITTYLLYN